MSKNLVIVESPAKAKTIQGYLGKDFIVKSCFGHIRDLPKKGISIDIEHDFKPTYEIPADKKRVVSELKKDSKTAEMVWLASDEDREGEAIAWHLTQALGIEPSKTKRIVFHEITKPAIENAVKNPRNIDVNLVDAQQARRVLDRLVGYELSPVLWKKVMTGLSAGRVQSVAVRLIVDREREIKEHASEISYKTKATLKSDNKEIPAELDTKLKDEKQVNSFFGSCKGATYKVGDISDKPATRNPGPPFTTSTLQQEASRRLGFSVKQTMTLAQRLYEAGHITYMRTDSTNLSNTALDAAKDYITKNYGDKYYQFRQYKTKNSSAQEAHEAIRPTNFSNRGVSVGDDQQARLYEIIWQRALASQMSPASIKKTEVTIDISTSDYKLIGKGEVLVFDGFLKVSGNAKDDVILPQLKVGEELDLVEMVSMQSFSRPSAHYSEASLVKKLEELGIGRPSTYSPTISTIQTRGYIEKRDLEGQPRKISVISLKNEQISTSIQEEITGADKNKLMPTHLAEMTTDFLVKHFADIVDYDFTAKSEDGFDKIAEGKETWQEMIKNFYKSFHPLIEKSADISRKETSQAKVLGLDPKSRKPIMARYGRYGPMLQMGETESEEKPRFAPMPAGATLDNITLDQAIHMFDLPRIVGKTEDGREISSNIGRFGPYIQVDKTYVSIKPLDPLGITEEQARKLFTEKLKKDKDKYIHQFSDGINVINGPFGPYITDGKKNAKIPKDLDPKQLSREKCIEILANAPDKKRRFRSKN